MALTGTEQRFWQAYLDSLPDSESRRTAVVRAGHAGSPEITDELLALYLAGTKTAGSSVVEDFTTADDPLPQVGDHWLLLASDGEPRCILRTTRVEITPFDDVSEEIAVAEGEGDLSVGHWKMAHAESYEPHLREWGLAAIEEATIVTEFFEIVFRASGQL